MIKGTVKFFNNAKGFGFITPDDGGKDVFVPAATITASATGRLKAGQRVSFETEPDPKGPKAVKLTLLDEAPREVVREGVREAARETVRENGGQSPARDRPSLVLYHEPDSEESGEVLDALKDAGHEPRLLDVTASPPGRDELRRLSLLLREADQSLVRRYDPLFLELQLDDRFISESEFWQGIYEHPQLINAPVLATANKARLVKSAGDVRAFLGGPAEAQAKPKGLSPRMAALMQGKPLPPKAEAKPDRPEKLEKIEPAPKAIARAEPEAKPKKAALPEKKPAKVPAKKVPTAKPAAKPAKKAVKKVAKKK